MQSNEKAEKEINSEELDSTSVERKGLSNLLIGKPHLGDFGRSLGVFGFYQVMLYITLVVLHLWFRTQATKPQHCLASFGV